MLDLLTNDEKIRLERRIKENQNIKERVGNKYEEYLYLFDEISKVLPTLKELSRNNKKVIPIE